MAKTYRAAVIGATGRGDYGHGLDSVYHDLPNVQLVAIADADPSGLAKAGQRNKVTNLYADYRQMLAKEKPDLVSVAPRHTDQRVEMIQAVAAAGAHVFSEKPLATDLADADVILETCETAGVKIAVAHQLRSLPPVRKLKEDLAAGKYGRLLRMRARGKEDRRGGGEDLLVLGTHMMDLMCLFAGTPHWVTGHVAVGDRDATIDDRQAPTEPIGSVLGDSLTGTYGFDNGVRGFFDSQKGVARDTRVPFFVLLECDEATIQVRNGEVFIYPSSCIIAEDSVARQPKLVWKKLWIEDWHFTAEHKERDMGTRLRLGNAIIVNDLIAAIEEDREPMVSGRGARDALEMIHGVYASHLAGGGRTAVPLERRKHPLAPA